MIKEHLHHIKEEGEVVTISGRSILTTINHLKVQQQLANQSTNQPTRAWTSNTKPRDQQN